METHLLKTLLSTETYKVNSSKLPRSIFSEDADELYDLLNMAHAKYDHHPSLDECYAM